MEEIDIGLAGFSRQLAEANDIYRGREPEVSVIVPCFNSEDFIHICLESLAKQTLPQSRFEVICVDDCSSDRTGEIVSSFADRIQNLRLIRHETNKKQGGARNTGIDQATGRFVLFIDSDDFLRLDALELLTASAGDAEVVMGQLLRVKYDQPYRPQPATSRTVVDGDVVKSTLTNKLSWFALGALISRDLLNRNSIRFPEGVFFEDIEFCTEVHLNAKGIKTLPDHVYMYLQRNGSTVNSITAKKLDDSALAMSKTFKLAQEVPNGLETFKPSAVNWLRLQASRVRDGIAPLAERVELGKFFVEKAKGYGLDAYLSSAELNDLARIAAGEPKAPPPPANVGDVTCCSPWGGKLESEFAGKVIFFCEVDYHIRSAAPVVRALKRMGVASIIVDASKSTSFSTNRPLPEAERPLYADIDIREFNVKEVLPFSTEASAFVFTNDLTYTKRLILENFGFGVPTFGLYEGINDDWNLDRTTLRRPYRNVDYLLLPGVYQQGFYEDRECRIVGLPNVRSRLTQQFVAPRFRRAIINVNFTYGVLEHRRNEYVETAVQACRELGLDYVITQHPADKADLSAYNVAKTSVYDLLDEGTILISRFSTTMLEALAMGRPVIYHNPIAEKVPKFAQSLGAYSISDSTESLKSALRSELDFVDGGGDVRSRAALFLHFHCHTGAKEEPEELAAKAIFEVVSQPTKRFAFKIDPKQRIAPPLVNSLASRLRAAADLQGGETWLITCMTSALLLETPDALKVLETDKVVKPALRRALDLRPENDELRLHFDKVLEFAQGKRFQRLSA